MIIVLLVLQLSMDFYCISPLYTVMSSNNRVDMLIDSQDEGEDDDDDEDDEAYTPTDIDSEEGDSSEDYSEESDWSGEAEDSSGKSKWQRYTDVPVFVELLGKLNSLFKLIYSCVLHLLVCQDNDTNIPQVSPDVHRCATGAQHMSI